VSLGNVGVEGERDVDQRLVTYILWLSAGGILVQARRDR
jgi:hypothetical protein